MNRPNIKNVAIIPVRGGSSSVSRKNMRIIAGKPLLWYIIQAAKAAIQLDCIIVSSEDEEIINYAKSLNIEVFCHPQYLSSNTAPSFGVIEWDVNELHKLGFTPKLFVILRATSPFCKSYDIDAAINLFYSNEQCDSVVSVSKLLGIHPIKLKSIDSEGRLLNIFGLEKGVPTRRQELDEVYMRNAAIYVSTSDLILNGRLWGENCFGYVMPEERSININTEFQFKMAKLQMENDNLNEYL